MEMDIKPFNVDVKVELFEFEDDHNNSKGSVTGEESMEMEIKYQVEKEDEAKTKVSFPNECFGSADQNAEYLSDDDVDVDVELPPTVLLHNDISSLDTSTSSKLPKNLFSGSGCGENKTNCDQYLETFTPTFGLHDHIRKSHQRLENKTENNIDAVPLTIPAPVPAATTVSKYEKNAFKCDQCLATYSTNRQLRGHKKKLHNKILENQFPFQCQVCLENNEYFYFQTQEKLDDHMKHNCKSEYRKKLSFECDVCFKKFSKSTGVERHKMFTHKENGLKFTEKCNQSSKQAFKSSDSECLEVFDNLEDTENHEEEIKKVQRSFECDICFEKLNTLTEANMHKEHLHPAHTKREKQFPFQCQFCLENNEYFYFQTQEKLDDHMKHNCKSEYRKKLSFECDVCFKKFSKSTGVERHKMFTHEENGLKLIKKWKQSSKKTFKCSDSECLEVFDNLKDLKKHQKEKTKAKRSFECGLCFIKFRTPKGVKIHKKKVHKMVNKNDTSFLLNPAKKDNFLKCDLCPDPQQMIFTRRLKLKQHVIEVHGKDKAFQCTIENCSKTFIDEESLEKHLKICKKNPKNCSLLVKFKCNLCPFSSDDEKPLIIHNNVEHCLPTVIISNLLKFKCILCRFSSDDEKQLIIHNNVEHCLPTVIISKSK